MLKKRNLLFLSLLILGALLISGCWLIPSPTYTVTYDGNGHTGGSVPNDSALYKENDTVTVLDKGDLVMTGHIFAGWNTQADGTGASQAEGSVFTIGAADVTLYAQWTINTYTVTFRSQGGSHVSSQVVNYGGKVTEPADPTREDYTFGGWFKESGCTNAWDFANDTVTSDVTLYAKWTGPPSIPKLISPENGSTFNQYPRELTLDWESSTGAGTITYVLEWYYYDNDGELWWLEDLLNDISETSYFFTFSGKNLGRWRVKAKSEYGESEWSEWFYFEFTV